MEEKGYRLIKCPGSIERCGQELRLKGITKKLYNVKVRVTCTKCGMVFNTTIHAPGSETKTQNPPEDAFEKAINESTNIFEDLFSRLGVKPRK